MFTKQIIKYIIYLIIISGILYSLTCLSNLFLVGGPMLDSVTETIKRYNMISPGDRIVVGVSGGPDSMALLHMLCSIREEFSLYIHVVHLNHMLRGREADSDTEYVRGFCTDNDIPFTIEYADINELSRKSRLSSEQAGRKARYELFTRVAKDVNANKIALAHNMNDQAETVFLRLIRGSGLDGLCGISPVRDGIYIRPLLFTPRADIEEYCSENNLNPREDSTNFEPLYTRNKIRLELLPFIKHNFNANIEHSLSSLAEILAMDNDFISSCADQAYLKVAKTAENGVMLDIALLKKLHGAIRSRCIRKALGYVKGDLTDIELKHVELINSLVSRGSTGAAVEVPGGIRAEVSYGFLRVAKAKDWSKPGFCHRLQIPGATEVPEADCMIIASVGCGQNVNPHDRNRFIKYFDYDRIKGNLFVRNRREGDYIVPLGMTGRKKIKELFIDDKIPRFERNGIPLIACGSEILWAIGYNINDNYKISISTKTILKVEFIRSGGNNNVKRCGKSFNIGGAAFKKGEGTRS